MIISIEKKQEELLKGETQMKTLSGGFEEGEYIIIEEIVDPTVTTTVATTRYLTLDSVSNEISTRQEEINKLTSEVSIWQSLQGEVNE